MFWTVRKIFYSFSSIARTLNFIHKWCTALSKVIGSVNVIWTTSTFFNKKKIPLKCFNTFQKAYNIKLRRILSFLSNIFNITDESFQLFIGKMECSINSYAGNIFCCHQTYLIFSCCRFSDVFNFFYWVSMCSMNEWLDDWRVLKEQTLKKFHVVRFKQLFP